MAKHRAAHARVMLKRDKLDPWKVDSDMGVQKTFGEVVRLWIAKNKPSWRTAKQYRNAELLLLVHSKALLDRPIIQIKPSHIHDALIHLWDDSYSQVRRALVKIAQVFDYAKSNGLYFAENPARWREKQKHLFPQVPKSEDRHFAAMDYELVPGFIPKLRQCQSRSVAAAALEVTILTACASGEVFGMKWSELDLQKQVWTIPPDRQTKRCTKAHEVPLCARVVELLKRQQDYAVGQLWFTGYHAQAADAKTMRLVLDGMNVTVTVHGFRSSFTDWAGDCTNFRNVDIEGCLAHKVGSKHNGGRIAGALPSRSAARLWKHGPRIANLGNRCPPSRSKWRGWPERRL